MMRRLREALVQVGLCLFVLTIYLLFPTKNYYFDGVFFARSVEAAPALTSALLHPNHLIYEPFIYCCYRALLFFGVHVRALSLMQITNSILSAAAALLMFRLLRRALDSTYFALVLALLFAFSATWWRYSTDADAYVPSLLCLVACFNLVLPGRRTRPLHAAAVLTLAVLFHQIAVVAFPALVFGVYLQTRALSQGARCRSVIGFAATGCALTLATYLICVYLSQHTLDPGVFLRYVTYHDPDLPRSAGIGDSLRSTIMGNARLFFGGRFNLISGLLNPITVTLALALVALISLLAVALARSSSDLRANLGAMLSPNTTLKQLALVCRMWIGIFLLFLCWVTAPLYRIFYLPPLVALCGVVFRSGAGTGPRHYRAAMVAAIVALVNFLFLIYPYSHVEKVKPVALAFEMKRAWGSRAVIYYAKNNADVNLFRYLAPESDWRPAPADLSGTFENELKGIYAGGRTAWLEATEIDHLSSTSEGAAWLGNHALKESWREISDGAYNIKFIQVVARR